MLDPATQAQIILDSFMNRFDADFNDEVTASEIERRLTSEGVDPATAKVIAQHAMSNWDVARSGSLTTDDVGRLAKTWADFPGDVSRSAFATTPEEPGGTRVADSPGDKKGTENAT